MPNIAMPAMSRLVAIGRRMKISERFMSLAAPAAATAATCAAAPGAGARSATAWRQISGDARARLQPQLAFGDHRFSRFQPFLHHDVVGDALAWRDGALLDRRIRFDDEHVLAVL